jgi:hypothetical protein
MLFGWSRLHVLARALTNRCRRFWRVIVQRNFQYSVHACRPPIEKDPQRNGARLPEPRPAIQCGRSQCVPAGLIAAPPVQGSRWKRPQQASSSRFRSITNGRRGPPPGGGASGDGAGTLVACWSYRGMHDNHPQDRRALDQQKIAVMPWWLPQPLADAASTLPEAPATRGPLPPNPLLPFLLPPWFLDVPPPAATNVASVK